MKAFTGTREAFAAALEDLAQEGMDVLFVSADSLKAMRATGFAQKHPERYVEVGIAEQAAVDIAAGLASCSAIPFVGTYAGFLTMRACEQMRTFVAYPDLNVKFIGINGGLIGGEREGATHQFYEDISILSAIPNFTIFTPADPGQTYWAVKEAARVKGPVYIRAASGREYDVYDRETTFSMDGMRILKEHGNDVVLFSSGFVLNRALEAAELLKKQKINSTVADINIINKENPVELIDLIKRGKCLVTIEDHNVNGGLGSYICHLSCEYAPKRVARIGLSTFGESGRAKELADKYGLSPEAICNKVRSLIARDHK